MVFASMIAWLLLAPGAPPSSSSSSAAAEDSRPNRAYRVDFPEQEPRGIVIFLHGLSLDPLDEEGDTMDAISEAARARGLVALFPIADRACGAQYCWRLDDVDDEIADVMDLVSVVEQRAGKHLRRRHLIGFSQGGFLVGAALQRNLLTQFTRVGVVAGGAVGGALPTHALPPVYLEAGLSDRWQRPTTRRLYAALSKARPRDDVRFREVPGDHDFDPQRASSFLRWFWGEDSTK